MSAAQPPTCGEMMSDRKPCDRLIHPAAPDVDPDPRCLMHSRDPAKDKAQFQLEVQAILDGTSSDHRPKDRFDFHRFVFPSGDFSWVTFTHDANFFRATFTRNADFSGATFTRNADFSGATFTQDADFSGATFTQNAFFRWATFTQDAHFRDATFTQNANFHRATFTRNAFFRRATFTQNAHFRDATFTQNADFSYATFTQNADFSWATFTHDADFSEAAVAGVLDFRFLRILKDGESLLHRVNERREIEVLDPEAAKAQAAGSAKTEGEGETPKKKIRLDGLRLRLQNTLLERIRFEDVRWHKQNGRLILQDELDLADPEQDATHELVADAYRRLVNNFEKARQYEWAEDAFIGEMEMRRRNLERFLFVSWSKAQGNWFWPRWRRWIGDQATKIYEQHPGVRRFGEQFSVTNLYRLLSNYGSSYRRAAGMLLGLLVFFALLLPLPGLRPAKDSDLKPQCPGAVPGSPDVSLISWGCALAHPHPARELWGTFKTGLWASVETATFQRDRLFEPATSSGRALAIVELIFVPGQLALFLLALRRRFRR